MFVILPPCMTSLCQQIRMLPLSRYGFFNHIKNYTVIIMNNMIWPTLDINFFLVEKKKKKTVKVKLERAY